VDEINLNNNTGWDRPICGQRSASKAYRDAGVPACLAFPILMRVTIPRTALANFIEQVMWIS